MHPSLLRMLACLGLLAGVAAPCAAQSFDAPRVDTLWATVHNHRIAFFVIGDAAAPAVILEPGGAGHEAWRDLPMDAAQFARVVTYDRPGYGLSEKCSRPRSAAVIAEELHEALAAIGIKPPFVLGGWSLGGSFVRVFAGTYPDEVAGLVLIDPAPEDFYERAAREHPDVWKPMLEEQNRRMATRGPGHQAEWAAWDATMRQARASDSVLKAPVVLLTATKAVDTLQGIWIDEHRKWARRMPNVSHVLVEGAGHAIHRDNPAAVLLAVRRLLPQAVRAPVQPGQSPVAIMHVTVIDVATGARLPDRTVLVRDRHIVSVDTAPRVRVPDGTRRVDGRGRFLIPGLWDMHVHLPGDRVVRTNMFPLFIANGVTGVRDMWGDCDSGCATSDDDVRRPVPAAVVQRWKHDITSGALVGPRIVRSSAIFEGPSPMFPGSYAIRSPGDAREKVRLARQHGVDFIKVLPSLSRESYMALVDEAKQQNLPVAGHVPFAMTPIEVSAAGQRSIEHVDDVAALGYGRASCSARPDSLRAAFSAMVMPTDTSTAERARRQTVYRRLLAEGYSETLCAQVFAHFARNGTWRVPTLLVNRNGPLARLGDTLIVADPRLRYVDRRMRAAWLQPPPGVPPRTAEDSAAIRGVVRLVLSLPGAMQRAGVPLLAGTDAPNPWVIPGFSLHDELALMVTGGLTPLEALRTATINPARFLNATDSLGLIGPGKLADLVLLDADPLADIHNTSRIVAVISDGRLFDRSALDELLAVAAAARATGALDAGGAGPP